METLYYSYMVHVNIEVAARAHLWDQSQRSFTHVDVINIETDALSIICLYPTNNIEVMEYQNNMMARRQSAPFRPVI